MLHFDRRHFHIYFLRFDPRKCFQSVTGSQGFGSQSVPRNGRAEDLFGFCQALDMVNVSMGRNIVKQSGDASLIVGGWWQGRLLMDTHSGGLFVLHW